MTNQQVKTIWTWVLAELLGGNVNTRRHRAKQRDEIESAILELEALQLETCIMIWKPERKKFRPMEMTWENVKSTSKKFQGTLENNSERSWKMLHKDENNLKIEKMKMKKHVGKIVYIYIIKFNNNILYLVVNN